MSAHGHEDITSIHSSPPVSSSRSTSHRSVSDVSDDDLTIRVVNSSRNYTRSTSSLSSDSHDSVTRSMVKDCPGDLLDVRFNELSQGSPAASDRIMNRPSPIPRVGASTALFGRREDGNCSAARISYEKSRRSFYATPPKTRGTNESFTAVDHHNSSAGPEGPAQTAENLAESVPLPLSRTTSSASSYRRAVSPAPASDTRSLQSLPISPATIDQSEASSVATGGIDCASFEAPPSVTSSRSGGGSVMHRPVPIEDARMSRFTRTMTFFEDGFKREIARQHRLNGTGGQTDCGRSIRSTRGEISSMVSRFTKALRHPWDAWDRVCTRSRMEGYRKEYEGKKRASHLETSLDW